MSARENLMSCFCSRQMRWAAVFAVGAVLAWSAGGLGDVQGSKHDFTAAGFGGDACSACHIPHADAGPKTGKWEQKPRSDVTLYRGAAEAPGPLSMRCLGCHDGTIATDTFVEETAGPALASRDRIARSGDLRRNHPIGVDYPSRRRTFQPASQVTSLDRVRLFGGKVECTSCHDPHNQYGLPAMLVMPNDRSQLCYTCHKK